MFKNKVAERLEEYAGSDRIMFISGEIINIGTKDCKMLGNRGSVYGIAVKLGNEEEKASIFYALDERGIQLEQWKSIGGNFYPLYWGKDCNMGSRLQAHTTSSKSTGTIQLDNKKQQILSGKRVVYGAVPCLNTEAIEKQLQQDFPDILKTKTLKET